MSNPTVQQYIASPKWDSFKKVLLFFPALWKPFMLSIALQVISSLIEVNILDAITAALVQLESAEPATKGSWLYNFFLSLDKSKTEILLLSTAFALVARVFVVLLEIIIKWSGAWSFAILNNMGTPEIIKNLVFSNKKEESVSHQESTVIQRWLAMKSIAEFYHNVVADAIGAIFNLVIILVWVFQRDALSGKTLMIIVAIWAILLIIISPKVLKKSKYYAEREEMVGRNIRTANSLHDSLKLGEVFTRFFKIIVPNIQDYSRSISLKALYDYTSYGILSGIASIAPIIVVMVWALFSQSEEISISEALALFLFASKIGTPLVTISNILPTFQYQRINFIRFQSLLESSGNYPVNQHSVIKDSRVIQFGNVFHRYAGGKEMSFREFSLERGKIVCLAGISGSGKTTLLKLISGRYKSNVKIVLDEHKQFPIEALFPDIAYLPQEPKLAECSLKDNLNIFANGVIENPYLRQAYYTVVNSLADGENTIITSDVIGLSVGQRRAVSLINVMSSNKLILVLDEPLSNIDGKHQELLWNAIKFESKTKFVLLALHEDKYKNECDIVISLPNE